MFNKKLLATAIAGSSAVLGQIPAFAENESSMVLEEVVVTATRRAESAQDVPIPVTAISGDRLERSFAQDARDLNGIAPN
ncbi:MAG: hypothetical protein RIC89_10185, partial [Pseudomonadales bacterium]